MYYTSVNWSRSTTRSISASAHQRNAPTPTRKGEGNSGRPLWRFCLLLLWSTYVLPPGWSSVLSSGHDRGQLFQFHVDPVRGSLFAPRKRTHLRQGQAQPTPPAARPAWRWVSSESDEWPAGQAGGRAVQGASAGSWLPERNRQLVLDMLGESTGPLYGRARATTSIHRPAGLASPSGPMDWMDRLTAGARRLALLRGCVCGSWTTGRTQARQQKPAGLQPRERHHVGRVARCTAWPACWRVRTVTDTCVLPGSCWSVSRRDYWLAWAWPGMACPALPGGGLPLRLSQSLWLSSASTAAVS